MNFYRSAWCALLYSSRGHKFVPRFVRNLLGEGDEDELTETTSTKERVESVSSTENEDVLLSTIITHLREYLVKDQ